MSNNIPDTQMPNKKDKQDDLEQEVAINVDLCQAVFTLMNDEQDILLNLEEVQKHTLDYAKLNLAEIDKIEERFYNLLLATIKNMPDSLWINDAHRNSVYEIIKQQLDLHSNKPTPYTKDKFYV
jgi:hypothetical protein